MALAAPQKSQITLADVRGLFRMAEAEIALGVEPIDLLEAELDTTKAEWSAGWAEFGPGNLLDADRKALVSARQLKANVEWNTTEQGSMTDKKLDAAAHADPVYTDWLLQKKLERAQWIQLNEARDLIHARIARGNALLRAVSRGG